MTTTEDMIKPNIDANGDPIYDERSFKVLEGLEAVRKRPGMYIGDTESRGFHHLLSEIYDNSIDEALAGHAKNIIVTLHKDGSMSVSDDGRGIPVGLHPTKKIPAATLAMTTLHAGGKFEGGAYKTSGGLHGVGASVVNALSTRFEMRIMREGGLWAQDFVNGGKPVKTLEKIKNSKDHGTSIRFWPDLSFFENVTGFDSATIRLRLRNSSYLNPGLNITYISEPENTTETLRATEFADILPFLAEGNTSKIITSAISGRKSITSEKGDVEVFLAFRWQDMDEQIVATFANNIHTPLGGTHETGFRQSLLMAINNYGNNAGLMKSEKDRVTAEDVAEGLVAAIAVRLSEPKFEAQTKERLANSEARGAVQTVTYATIQTFFEENPAQAKIIVQKAMLSAKGRAAAKRAKDLAVGRKTVLNSTALPGKLADCREKDPALSEIFIVEGDSAGGTAKTGRDSAVQAILPLRGKILNVLKADEKRALESEQIKNLVMALGCGTGKHFDVSKVRYHKIVMMTDADVDGEHIATLLLTFFHTYMPGLIDAGYVYTAMPPLFRVQKGKEDHYIANDADLDAFFVGKDRSANWKISRFKGLGEMDAEQLWDTTLDPATRVLGKITYSDGGHLESAPIFEVLMGEEVAPRRQFIEEHAAEAILDL